MHSSLTPTPHTHTTPSQPSPTPHTHHPLIPHTHSSNTHHTLSALTPTPPIHHTLSALTPTPHTHHTLSSFTHTPHPLGPHTTQCSDSKNQLTLPCALSTCGHMGQRHVSEVPCPGSSSSLPRCSAEQTAQPSVEQHGNTRRPLHAFQKPHPPSGIWCTFSVGLSLRSPPATHAARGRAHKQGTPTGVAPAPVDVGGAA